MEQLRLALFISGELGFISLQCIVSQYPITAVFTDQSSNSIISFCTKKSIPLFIGNPRAGKAKDFIDRITCDYLVSVNYLYLIEEDLISWPTQYAINFHGSLLPKYKGRTPHVWAIINGEEKTGITAHLINKEVDSGDIIMHKELTIKPENTGGDILAMFKELYPGFVLQTLDQLKQGTAVLKKQDIKQATYFGKRTPGDGRINWNWNSNRLINWIRAQAKPYPGAFFFYNSIKFHVHLAMKSDYGFHYQAPNGEILKVLSTGLVVKCCDSAVLLEKIEGFDMRLFAQSNTLV